MTALILQLIEFNSCERVNNCNFDLENKHVPLSLQNLIESFLDVVFTKTVGKIKDCKVKLHVDTSVKLVIEKEKISFVIK